MKPKETEVSPREWRIYDNDEYGPAWDGPRFSATPNGILVREVLPEGATVPVSIEAVRFAALEKCDEIYGPYGDDVPNTKCFMAGVDWLLAMLRDRDEKSCFEE